MKYHRISGVVCVHTTGLIPNCEAERRDGFDLYATSGPIDAPEAIPGGAMVRIEWPSHIDKQTRAWFPSQHITLRGYQ